MPEGLSCRSQSGRVGYTKMYALPIDGCRKCSHGLLGEVVALEQLSPCPHLHAKPHAGGLGARRELWEACRMLHQKSRACRHGVEAALSSRRRRWPRAMLCFAAEDIQSPSPTNVHTRVLVVCSCTREAWRLLSVRTAKTRRSKPSAIPPASAGHLGLCEEANLRTGSIHHAGHDAHGWPLAFRDVKRASLTGACWRSLGRCSATRTPSHPRLSRAAPFATVRWRGFRRHRPSGEDGGSRRWARRP